MDLFVIGHIGMREVSRLLSGVSEVILSKINPHVMSSVELKKRINAEDNFISGVKKSSKLFVIGTENDLKAMAE